MARRKKEYDDDALVLAIAQGHKSCAQIAREFGLSPSMVSYIASGSRRPELQPRIEAARRAFRQQALRLAARMAAPAVAKLAKLLAPETKPTAEVQRKAAVDILKLALGESNVPVTGPEEDPYLPPGVEPADVQEFYEWKTRVQGGPTREETGNREPVVSN